MAPNSEFEFQTFNPFSVNELDEINNELDP